MDQTDNELLRHEVIVQLEIRSRPNRKCGVVRKGKERKGQKHE